MGCECGGTWRVSKSRIGTAIEKSWRENRTVHVAEATASDWTDAICEAEDSVEVDGELDAWGTTDDGHEWRLRLVRADD